MGDRAASRVALLEAGPAAPGMPRAAALAASGAGEGSAIGSIGNPDAGGPRCYPGGKNGAGVYQRLISLMPPHEVYIEAFLGSGAVLRRKRAAPGGNIGIDVDAGVIAGHGDASRWELVCADALEWLSGYGWPALPARALVYCDPPYLGSARARPQRGLYRFEMMGEEEHVRLLRILAALPAMVMISGYASALYDEALRDWRRTSFTAQTRGGPATEVVWMNFPAPAELHDYRFQGEDFRDRNRLARKIGRLRRKLAALPPLERAAVIAGIGEPAGPFGTPVTP